MIPPGEMMIVRGVMDLHVHVYHDATVLGVEPDTCCLQRWGHACSCNLTRDTCCRGVTTVVDGGSAGCMTYPGLRRFVVDQSSTRVLASCTVLYCTVLYCTGELQEPGAASLQVLLARC